MSYVALRWRQTLNATVPLPPASSTPQHNIISEHEQLLAQSIELNESIIMIDVYNISL